MALGSAPSSPSSPTTNPNYLPPFLIGDNQAASSNTPLSTEIRKNESFTSTPSDRNNLRQKLFSPSFVDTMQSPKQPTYNSNENRSGPPRQSLFDTIDIKRGVDKTLSDASKIGIVTSPNEYGCFSRKFEESYRDESSLGLNESIRGIDRNQWITVFGFPSNAASVVLACFANYGTIVDKRFPTQGNWVHLKYNSPVEASKALSLNGKLISNNVMIGVSLYQCKEGDKENANTSLNMPIKVRSLRQSFVSPQNSNTVLSPENVPHKSTGIVTKAMEYVFGW